MSNKRKDSKSLLKKSWVLSILSFLILQMIFILCELTGWIPNLRDTDGKLFGNITEYSFLYEWFSFYETPYFNVFTVFLGIILLLSCLFGIIKKLFFNKSIVR